MAKAFSTLVKMIDAHWPFSVDPLKASASRGMPAVARPIVPAAFGETPVGVVQKRDAMARPLVASTDAYVAAAVATRRCP